MHTDLGCNAEVYMTYNYVELETLSPMATLEPGQSTGHTETWEIYPAVEMRRISEAIPGVLAANGFAVE